MRAGHVEQHFTAGEMVRDVVIGMSDGLTVPFALTAGLSSYVFFFFLFFLFFYFFSRV